MGTSPCRFGRLAPGCRAGGAPARKPTGLRDRWRPAGSGRQVAHGGLPGDVGAAWLELAYRVDLRLPPCIAKGDALEHHADGSVTLSPDEAGHLRALLDSVMAGNRIQATLTHKSRDEYQTLVSLRRGLLGG